MKLTVSVIKLPVICAKVNSLLFAHYLVLEIIILYCKQKNNSLLCSYRVAQNSKPYRIIYKSYSVVLKLANVIIFFPQFKVSSNIILAFNSEYSMHDLISHDHYCP